ncbi:dihydroneopterin aldolase [Candidatus Curculioniphilus buchneri]|uniref:dihydroneopterin aldolase n=1 Tax=Candidatus Curculioniphilus buchneri TaxID=690594 RepID=UPI00376EB8DA
MDIILIEELTIMAVIGVYDWEQNRLQKLILNLEMGWENQIITDNNDSKTYLNYEKVSESVLSVVSCKRFSLIENVAEAVAERLISQFQLPWIRIKVSKPGAVPQALSVGVIIERKCQKE